MRIGITIGTIIALLFASPLFVVLGIGALALRWRAWEVLLIGLLIDMIYVPLGGFLGIPFPATIIALLVVWGLEPFRDQLYLK